MGDEILAAGGAARLARELGTPVAITTDGGTPRWSEVWAGHPDILPPHSAAPSSPRYVDAAGNRHYIERWDSWGNQPRLVYSSTWAAQQHPPRIYLADKELAAGQALRAQGPYIVVQPIVKDGASPNKDWGLERYQEVVRRAGHLRFVQLVPRPGHAQLRGAEQVQTATFRDACGILAGAQAYLGPEGGLHLAAAALGIPAVVIFGHFGSVEATGFPQHANLAAADGACGRWAPCPDCRGWLEALQPETVLAALEQIVRGEV